MQIVKMPDKSKPRANRIFILAVEHLSHKNRHVRFEIMATRTKNGYQDGTLNIYVRVYCAGGYVTDMYHLVFSLVDKTAACKAIRLDHFCTVYSIGDPSTHKNIGIFHWLLAPPQSGRWDYYAKSGRIQPVLRNGRPVLLSA